MYGLVNKGVEDLVLSEYGEDAWDEIKRRANVDVAYFTSMSQYPDEVTFQLVGAASEFLGVSPEQVLIAFGRHWIRYTAQKGYGSMLDVCGKNIREFLQQLDDMHSRLKLRYVGYQPPSFRCEDIEGGLALHYITEREGLAGLVIGILEGLGERFQTPVEVRHVEYRTQGAPHDVFHVLFEEH